jgi:hypothetical protein
MFCSTIVDGHKGPAKFWEKEWGTINLQKYDYIILDDIGYYFRINLELEGKHFI